MLTNIVNLIDSSDHEIDGGSLFCRNYKIADNNCLGYLEENSILNDNLTSTAIGDTIDIELSLVHLNRIGYYESCEAFVLRNKYEFPTSKFYIEELKTYNDSTAIFIYNYSAVIEFMDSIKSKKISSFVYTEIDVENCILFSEEKSILLPLVYSAEVVRNTAADALREFSYIFNEEKSEKQLIFINEMLTAISSVKSDRFVWLLSNFNEFFEKSKNAYQFYLSKFSYNKLKIELDSKALEFTQKVQSVINESQTKLIAIPAAFTLSIATFNFKELVDIKNIATIPGLIIFAVLIQMFINNQKSTLKFIGENVISYKDIFNSSNDEVGDSHKLNIEQISSKFALMEKELTTQRRRLRITEIILWATPAILISIWFFLLGYKFFALGFLMMATVTYIVIFFLIKCNSIDKINHIL